MVVSEERSWRADQEGQGRGAGTSDKAAELKHPDNGKSSLTSSYTSAKLTWVC